MVETVKEKKFSEMRGSSGSSDQADEDDETSSSYQRMNTEGGGVNELVIDARYTLAWHHLPQDGKDIFELFFPFPDNVREATRRDGLSVIIKRIKHSSEIDILKYLGSGGGGSNHIIELLDMHKIDAQWLIVMPKHIRLCEFSHVLSASATVYSF
ncbi:SubName: Full=Uncharacterized protein {ECO:0000313/EMBL:CCA76955.1} [Serendipita indica DSM 11827]|nr:SubName: Full=Uncharacterized protein {ECO:0000313/EMBL:CCA76955.1} [Serendipita indica DSM 11827]